MIDASCYVRCEELLAWLNKNHCAYGLVFNRASIRALTGVDCDEACLLLRTHVFGKNRLQLLTDFRYRPEIKRVAPELWVGDIKIIAGRNKWTLLEKCSIGYEETISHRRFLKLQNSFPHAPFLAMDEKIESLRMIKTPDEIARVRAAARLNDEIWAFAKSQFRAGMTERDMARLIQKEMIMRGDGEAFATIVCIGQNAAECHHTPDETVWDGQENILVDMGVKLNGACSDLTRNIVSAKASAVYKNAYSLVLEANARAREAARPGMEARALDQIARDFLTDHGFGKAFGHSLGHGVGFEIHEAPAISRRSKTILKPGMIFTIEPGVYLPNKFGIRIEDLVLMTETGCELLSHAEK